MVCRRHFAAIFFFFDVSSYERGAVMCVLMSVNASACVHFYTYKDALYEARQAVSLHDSVVWLCALWSVYVWVFGAWLCFPSTIWLIKRCSYKSRVYLEEDYLMFGMRDQRRHTEMGKAKTLCFFLARWRLWTFWTSSRFSMKKNFEWKFIFFE